MRPPAHRTPGVSLGSPLATAFIAGQTTLKLGFDIFRRLDDGSPLWVAQVNSLAEARTRLATLRQLFPGQYFVRDAETGQFITAEVNENPGEV